MPRTFTTAFTNQAKARSAVPFQILEIDWMVSGTSTPKFYADRPLSGFVNNAGDLPTLETQLVMQWPSISLALGDDKGDTKISFQNQCQVTLDDAGGALTSLLSGSEQQWQLVKIWRMFDDPSCAWGTDNALILSGVLRPFDWTGKDNQITLNIGDLGPLLAKSLSFPASSSIFTHVPPEYQDRQIPLCFGQAHRVEAVCVSRPWELTIVQSIAGYGAGDFGTYNDFYPSWAGGILVGPVTVEVSDTPSSFGLDGTGATQYQATLGTQAVTVTFNDGPPPTASIYGSGRQTIIGCPFYRTVDGSGNLQLVIRSDTATANAGSGFLNVAGAPWRYQLDGMFGNGWPVGISKTTWGSVPLGSGGDILGVFALVGMIAHYPFDDDSGVEYYVCQVSDINNLIYSNASSLYGISFLNKAQAIQAWPAGTVLRETGVNSIYIANALPSKNVIKVEGFGTVVDSQGTTRKDFVPLGQTASVSVSGSTTTTVVSEGLTINLNDNTWNHPAGTLFGQNVTTIKFPGLPRDLLSGTGNTALDDNRIWVTLDGVEDVGDSTGNLISNPATILLQLLENTHLMNVATGSINATSFANAASALAGYFCGFGIVEAVDGLTLLQHIASLSHSVLFFDQGQANLVVLSDSAGPLIWTGDTTTHDNVLQGSLSQSESAVDDVINDLTFKWRGYWDDKTGQNLLDAKNVKLTSVQAFGRIAKEINPVDIFWRRADVVSELNWWLAHLSSIFRYVTFVALLDALILQPGDWINVTWIDGGGRNLFGGAKSMEVIKCTDTGKDGLVEIQARFVQFTYG